MAVIATGIAILALVCIGVSLVACIAMVKVANMCMT